MTPRKRVARHGAAIASLVLGLGFGLPGGVGAVHLARTGETWTFLGFPTYGGGPFERIGLRSSVPLLTAFVVVCVAEVALAGLVWAGLATARPACAVLLPIEFAFWIGFALPAGPPLGVLRTALVAAGPRPS